MIDESTDFGQRTAHHLQDDEVLWLTTVTPGGQPVPNPVGDIVVLNGRATVNATITKVRGF